MQYILQQFRNPSFHGSFDADSLSDCVFNGIIRFNEINPTQSHMAVDELGASFFNSARQLGDIFQGILTDSRAFSNLIECAWSRAADDQYLGIVLTKPPETVAIILPPKNQRNNPAFKYYLFDSHSRPQYGYEGSYLAIADSMDDLVRRLKQLFPAMVMEEDLDANYAMMYNMFEATIFV